MFSSSQQQIYQLSSTALTRTAFPPLIMREAPFYKASISASRCFSRTVLTQGRFSLLIQHYLPPSDSLPSNKRTLVFLTLIIKQTFFLGPKNFLRIPCVLNIYQGFSVFVIHTCLFLIFLKTALFRHDFHNAPLIAKGFCFIFSHLTTQQYSTGDWLLPAIFGFDAIQWCFYIYLADCTFWVSITRTTFFLGSSIQ